jgi:hypothetical protein
MLYLLPFDRKSGAIIAQCNLYEKPASATR